MFSYFDSLAQATANLYGPYLKDPSEMVPPPATAPPGTAPTTRLLHGGNAVTAPAGKNMLLNFAMNVATSKVMGLAPVTNTWNALLNLPGSVLGGNTWRDNGNGTFATVRPPAFQGVSAPFEGGQVVRFHPIDLYVMGFIPAGEVGNIQLVHGGERRPVLPAPGGQLQRHRRAVHGHQEQRHLAARFQRRPQEHQLQRLRRGQRR